MADQIIANIGEKLVVGQLDMSFLTASSKLTPGTAVINGPCYIGMTPQVGVARATCMIGPPLPGTLPVSLEVNGMSNFAGITNTVGTINDLALSNILGFTNKLGAEIQAAFKSIFGLHTSAAVSITQGAKICQAVATTPLIQAQAGVFNTIVAKAGILTGVDITNCINLKKPFDIYHPTKKGWRLRYVCLEGPSADVYVRGKLVNSNIIELPDYWMKLVDPETITVNLTPIGTHQELFVEKIEWGTKIRVKNNSGSSINCYYTVYGERADAEKNIPEYEGTYDDYPGDNSQYVNYNRK